MTYAPDLHQYWTAPAAREGTFLLPLGDAADLARHLNARVWGDALRASAAAGAPR